MWRLWGDCRRGNKRHRRKKNIEFRWISSSSTPRGKLRLFIPSSSSVRSALSSCSNDVGSALPLSSKEGTRMPPVVAMIKTLLLSTCVRIRRATSQQRQKFPTHRPISGARTASRLLYTTHVITVLQSFRDSYLSRSLLLQPSPNPNSAP